MSEPCEQYRARNHLAETEAEDRLAQNPKSVGAQFKADQEQEHNDAQLRDAGDLPYVGDKP